MADKKISQLTPKGATLADTDLLIISEDAGGGTYVTKSVTGAQIKAADNNIYNSDGMLTGDRTVDCDKNVLEFANSNLTGTTVVLDINQGSIDAVVNNAGTGDSSELIITETDITSSSTDGTATATMVVQSVGYAGMDVVNGSDNGTVFIANDGVVTITSSDSILSRSLSVSNTAITGINESDLSFTDITTNDVSTTKHGFAPKLPNDNTKFLDGTGSYDTVKDSDLSINDITTNNVSTSKHGFTPKAPNDTTQFLRGDGSWAVAMASGATNYTEAQRDAIVSPTTGLLIYNTTRNRFEFYEPFWGWHPIGATFRDWGVEFLEDFHTQSPTSPWTSQAINGGSISNGFGYFGVITINTGTNTNGGQQYRPNITGIQFGGGQYRFESRVRINTNSDGTNTFQFLTGFWDTYNIVNQVDGIYFLYDSQGITTGSAASGNWQIVTSSNSVRTFTTTTVAIDNTNLQKLRIDVNAAATSVEFYINDTLVGTHTTNIPSGAARTTGSGIYLQKSAGTTARTADIDYLFLKAKFTTPR